jgi:hypothetical protein
MSAHSKTLRFPVGKVLRAFFGARSFSAKGIGVAVGIAAGCLTPGHAQYEGRRTSGTPYDPYLGPVRQTYAGLSGASPTLDEVRSQMRTARRFRYYTDPAQPYVPQLPEVTEAKREGDCKAKSLWLIKKMGDRTSRYVIGKSKPEARTAHAWLLWPNGGIWLVLDPTLQSDVIKADQVAGRKWLAKYSYNGSGAYLH